jgi:hypothetical protein
MPNPIEVICLIRTDVRSGEGKLADGTKVYIDERPMDAIDAIAARNGDKAANQGDYFKCELRTNPKASPRPELTMCVVKPLAKVGGFEKKPEPAPAAPKVARPGLKDTCVGLVKEISAATGEPAAQVAAALAAVIRDECMRQLLTDEVMRQLIENLAPAEEIGLNSKKVLVN